MTSSPTPPTPSAPPAPSALLPALRQVLGPAGLLTQPGDVAPYSADWRGLHQGRPLAVARPADVQELSALMTLCHEAGIAMVPQGGNTGLVAGAVPSDSGDQVVISLGRMNRILDVDPVDLTMQVQAGVVLQHVQEAAAQAGCLFPLSIGSEGSAQIGGVLATNAGGNNTVRYGNARDLVLGLQVVLPDGRIWDGMRRLRKDNTGYCLRQLFVGSEGTLGVISAATLRIVPAPAVTQAAFCALDSTAAVIDLFARVQRYDPSLIQAFEYMSRASVAMVLEQIPGVGAPLASMRAPHYVLVELATPRGDARLDEVLERLLGQAMEDGLVIDAVIAQSEAQRLALWKLREEHSESQKRAGASVKNDVSVPVSRMPELIERATRLCEERFPGIRVVPFGHVGDGNIHFNLSQPPGADPDEFLARSHDLMDTVNSVVRDLDGSFSAEHGIGWLKPYMMSEWRGGAELETMLRIKRAIDPADRLNPGKLLP